MRGGKRIVSATCFDHAPALERTHAVCPRENVENVVGGKHERARARELRDKAAYLACGADVERRHRFVQKQNTGIHRKCASKRTPLCLAARKR